MTNNLIKTNQEMDSLEISKLTNKRHDNILRDIEIMLNELEIDSSKMSSEYLAWNWQRYKKYNLTKDLTLTLISWYSIKLRKAIIDRWTELEDIANKPKTFEEIMKDTLLLADQKVKELENKILLNKPKVEFAETIANTEASLLIRDYCKLINERGIKIGQNNLYRWLRENKYLMKDNKPYQSFMKYFSVNERIIKTIKWDRLCLTTYINWKGQEYFYNKLKLILA